MGFKSSHILVVRLSAMGDVAMVVPVIRALIKQYPNIKITMVSRAFLKPLFEDIPNVNFYTADVKDKHKGIKGLFKLSKELKQLKPNAIADLHDVLRSKVLRFFLLGIKNAVIDKGRAEKKALTRAENKIFKQLKTSHQRYADVFEKLGYPIDLSSPIFPEKEKLTQKTTNLIGLDHKKWIGIAPFAQHNGKMYPLDLIENVIDKLTITNNYKVLLFGGGEKEVKVLSNLEKRYANTISVAGKLNFKEELALISNLDVMVSMDSANGHLSAMQGVKTITIWGVTHPYAGFAPFNQPNEYQILPNLDKYPKLPCSIYGNKIFDGYEDVMRSINPQTVIRKIEEVV
ncbi:lipopolysaccharide heptosyltransferase family protein [Aureibaculum marinum]|uniref:Lipopolysaccharide heptosyltransferase family protein n=1 Tax=Aureibaculum marinum TaxID=2487930 RepID=A0A3N4NJ70_9FLAO|nr:glycosyltransferase family 9 protein [Aureibaculum marinum]RPD96452.1 lipopolysaccharide heptosyltransferase family protein [Aureibaculum marinum]